MPTKSRSRSTKSRSQVKDEYQDIADKVRSAEALTAKQAEIKAARDAEIKLKVADISPEAVTQKVTSAQFAINRTLAQVSEQLVEQTQELEAIKHAISMEKTELERLHGADKILSAMDVLVDEYEEKFSELSERYSQQRAELDSEIEKTKLAWAEEQRLHEKTVAERNTEAEKLRKREQADYEYGLNAARRRDQDHWQEQLRLAQQHENQRRSDLTRDWERREAELVAKESEITQLRETVAGFDARLDAEVKKAEAIVGNSVKREYEHKIQLLNKDTESQKNLLDSRIASLQDVVTKQATTIAELQARLKDSETNVKSIAEKALESASSTRTLSEVRSMMPHPHDGGNGSSRTKS